VSLINSVDSRVGFRVYSTPLVACIEDCMCYLDRCSMRSLTFTPQDSVFSETTPTLVLECFRMKGSVDSSSICT